ncbi:MAG: hypothetical protein IMW89_09325 [Ktedonobacteraceae bacterium]|nr:hypothetical protein [Ktedonobacteraceae bacterium]
MQKTMDHAQRTLLFRLLIGLCLALAGALSIFTPVSAQSHTAFVPTAGPTFQVTAGFDARYQDQEGVWVPVQVSLRNDGPDFNGKISIKVPAPFFGFSNTGFSASTYQQTINLPTGSQKKVTLYIPLVSGVQGTTQTINVDLLDSNGQKVGTQASTVRSIGPGDLFIGILSNQSTGFGPLSQIALPNPGSQIFVQPLNATSLPAAVETLKNFDMIILDNFDTGSLSQNQLTALERWVSLGGTLVAVGGPEWQRTLNPLPAGLLPVSINGTTTLSAGTRVIPIGGPGSNEPGQNKASDTLSAAAVASTAKTAPNSTVILSAGATPLIVQSQHNRGTVCYLAIDPTLEPVVGWPGATNLWKGLLFRGVGEQLLSSSQNGAMASGVRNRTGFYSNFSMERLLQSLIPNIFPATWLILVLLLGYVLVLGPARLLIVRLTKRRDWSWRIVLSTIVVFSLLSYGLAIQQKGTSIISSSISLIQLSRPAAARSNAHVATYVGVFVPSQGDFHVHISGHDLVQPTSGSAYIPGQSPSAYNAQQTTITAASDGTDVDLQGVNIWTLRSLVSKHDTQVQGGIVSRLTLKDGTLQGTVINTLPYGLNDVYVLIGNQFISLGSLAAGQSRDINTPLDSSQSTTSQSLADQIAASRHESIDYNSSPYYGQQLQTASQRRMAMLATLSGEGFDCGMDGCYSPNSTQFVINNGGMKRVIYGNGNPALLGGRDPLLLPDAPATLIAWTDGSPDITSSITINGTSSPRYQETMIQAPLDVAFSGWVKLPASMLPGHLIDVQGQSNDYQTLMPGVYTMTTGGMTFEFYLPGTPNLQLNSLTINESSNLLNITGSGNGGNNSLGDVNRFQIYLYNWQKGTWDSFNLSQYTLTVNNAQPYVSADGRVLVQFANQNSTLGTTLVTRPTLQIQGTITQ